MSIQFLTNISDQEFKEFLKDALKEILSGELGAMKQQFPDILDVQQASEFLKLKVTRCTKKLAENLFLILKKEINSISIYPNCKNGLSREK